MKMTFLLAALASLSLSAMASSKDFILDCSADFNTASSATGLVNTVKKFKAPVVLGESIKELRMGTGKLIIDVHAGQSTGTMNLVIRATALPKTDKGITLVGDILMKSEVEDLMMVSQNPVYYLAGKEKHESSTEMIRSLIREGKMNEGDFVSFGFSCITYKDL